MKKEFMKKYFSLINKNLNQTSLEKFTELIELINKLKKTNNKMILIGNGGSASIAAHCSVDFTKACGVSAINFNEPNFYSLQMIMGMKIRDFKAYSHQNDLVILISSRKSKIL